jgi:hypothetical protein
VVVSGAADTPNEAKASTKTLASADIKANERNHPHFL